MCIFIHIYSCGIYVHTWGMKGRSRNGEKECIYTPERYLPFGFPFPLKKEHVHTYPHTKWGRRPRNVCIHGGWKKRGRRGEKADVLPAHQEGRRPCEKGKELRRYPLFALLFAFLCFAFLLLFCLSFGLKRRGRGRGKEDGLPTTTTALQGIRERWRKGNLKRGWRGGERFFMEKKEN